MQGGAPNKYLFRAIIRNTHTCLQKCKFFFCFEVVFCSAQFYCTSLHELSGYGWTKLFGDDLLVQDDHLFWILAYNYCMVVRVFCLLWGTKSRWLTLMPLIYLSGSCIEFNAELYAHLFLVLSDSIIACATCLECAMGNAVL